MIIEDLNSQDSQEQDVPQESVEQNNANEPVAHSCGDKCKCGCFLLSPKFLLASNAVLLVAVVVLFILHFIECGSSSVAPVTVAAKQDTSKAQNFEVAYIQVDSLLANYSFAKQANESLLKKSESSRNQLQRKMQQWQKEAMDYQNKLQNNAFLSRDRAEAENNRLLKKRQELEQLDEYLTKELLQEQQKLNEQLKDTINIFLADYNKTHKYKIIMANTLNDNILFAEKECDITNDVVSQLNARFEKK